MKKFFCLLTIIDGKAISARIADESNFYVMQSKAAEGEYVGKSFREVDEIKIIRFNDNEKLLNGNLFGLIKTVRRLNALNDDFPIDEMLSELILQTYNSVTK